MHVERSSDNITQTVLELNCSQHKGNYIAGLKATTGAAQLRTVTQD